MSETAPATDQIHDSREWQSELRTVQRWIEEHPVLLGGAAILLPSISIYHYTTSEGVPLTIASPDIISALPSVLAAIAFLTVLLCALPLAPASLMFDGVQRGQDGKLRLLSRENGQWRRDFVRWLIAFAIPGVVIALGILGTVYWPNAEWPLFVSIFIASSSFTLIVSHVRRTRVFSESTLFVFGMSGLQMLLAIMAMQLALRIVDSSWNNAATFGLLLLSIVILAFVQIVAVLLVEQTSQKFGFVMQAFVAVLCLITFACILPPTGAALAGKVLQGSASGNMRCVQLRLTADAKDFAEIIPAASDSRDTAPLQLLSNTDGVYLARKNDSPKGTIYRIPTTSVSALTPCPDQKKTDKPSDQQ